MGTIKAVDRVRVVAGGEPTSGRVVSVKGAYATFQTPSRIPTSTEANAKITTHFEEPWDNPVFETANRFDRMEWIRSLHSKNGRYAAKLSRVRSHVDRFRGYALTKYFPQVGFRDPLSDRDLRILVELQLEAQCDIICVPEARAGMPLAEFERNLRTWWEYATKISPDVAVMPYLYLAQHADRFSEKLAALMEFEGALWSIGLVHASPQVYRPNYLSVAELGHHDFWVHCSGVRKFVSTARPLSQLHSIQYFGIDTVSTEVPRRPPFRPPQGADSSGANLARIESPGDVRYFVRSSLAYPRLSTVCPKTEPLPCDCPACASKDLPTLIQETGSMGAAPDPAGFIRAMSKIHDVYASTTEFDVARTQIQEARLKDYYLGKPGVGELLGIMR